MTPSAESNPTSNLPAGGDRFSSAALATGILVALLTTACIQAADSRDAVRSCTSDLNCPTGSYCSFRTRTCAMMPAVSQDSLPPGDWTTGADQAPFDADAEPDVATCAQGTACDDGDPCTFDDRCVEGLCAGTTYDCDDGQGCTVDICLGTGACDYAVAAGQCFVGGQCIATGATNTLSPCRACVPAVSQTAWTPLDGTPCDDQDPCTIDDACRDGQCQPGAPIDCDDEDPCTTDTCDPTTGDCLHELDPDC